jgi:hypothetical protein
MPGAGPMDNHPDMPAPLQWPRFIYRPNDALPPLAWCAELRRGESDVIVNHGPLVETSERGFFEGVWDGPFAEFGFGSASAVMGSGGCRDGPQARFVAPSHTYESLVSLSLGNRLLVSNSIAFALAAAGDGPDLRYPLYHRDLLQLQRRGITGDNPAAIPTAQGRQLQLHAATDLLIDRQLTLATRPQPRFPPPRDFAAYRLHLAQAVAALLDNAGDAARTNRLRRGATISAGYDSPATAVLAAEAGLRDAITFEAAAKSAGKPSATGDSGRAIGQALGMRVEAIDPGAWRRLPGCPDLEFLACSSGWAMLPMAGLARAWQNSVIFLGTMGDELWRRDRQDVLDSLARPREYQPCYAGLREFRLRAGIVFVHAPTIGATNASAIHRLAQAEEMQPWSVGGKYDRPIPRRIVETAGISRASFGQAIHMTIDTQTPEILRRLRQSSFALFVTSTAASLPLPQRWRLLFDWRCGPLLTQLALWIARKVHGLGRRLRLAPLDRLGKSVIIRITRWQWHEPMSVLYTFHWAMGELARRYSACLHSACPPAAD